MSTTRHLEQRIADHYAAEAPSRAPDWVLERIVAGVATTPQRRIGLGRRWGFPPITGFPKPGMTAVAIAAIGLVGTALVGGSLIGPVASPTPSPTVSAEPTISGGMWPQSSLEEVRRAQQLADAGDPDYTWQFVVSEIQIAQHHPRGGEQFFARFIEEVLGWEAYLWDEAFAHPEGLVPGDVVYVRCAPGGHNPLYPPDRDRLGCAPTIDDRRYEMVKINVAQLDRRGPLGIWVVTGWEMIEPAEQVAPPSDAEIEASLAAFLQARIDGEGAEDLVDVTGDDPLAGERVGQGIPLLYATSSGAPYERSEFEVVEEPQWPSGAMRFTARLFTEDGESVVEQSFSLERDGTGRLRLGYDAQPTIENGVAVPVTYAFLDGAVTYRAASPLGPSQDGFRTRDRLAIEGLLPDDDAPRRVLLLLADPRPVGPDCVEGPAPADAAALSRSIAADPDLEATAPVAVTIGGIAAVRVDVVLTPGAVFCSWQEGGISWSSPLLGNAPFHPGADRARLYLLDLPAGSEARVLAIVTVTDEDSFETVLAFAAPIVDSIELHAP
jgi:hypothetical protein